jgi:membrane protein YqaA with SNARE-associated domain
MLEQTKNKVWEWAERIISRPSARRWLYALSFAEASFFPIPPDFFLMPIVAKEPTRWFRIALWTSVMSVLGGLLGYLIGAGLFEILGRPLVELYHIEDKIVVVGEAFNRNAFLAMLTAAFTPIPFKAFTIAAGLFRIDIIPFIVASVIGRSTRFFVVAYIMKRYGTRMGEILFKYFNTITIVCAVIASAYLIWQVFF